MGRVERHVIWREERAMLSLSEDKSNIYRELFSDTPLETKKIKEFCRTFEDDYRFVPQRGWWSKRMKNVYLEEQK